MATGERTVKINILADGKQAQSTFDDTEKSAGGFGEKIGGIFSKIGTGLAVFSLAVDGVGKIKNAVGGFIDAAGNYQKIMAQTEAAVKSTGGAAGYSAGELEKMALSLANYTPFADETILTTQNLLLTFTNIGHDIFPEVTKTALDMSTALGTDTKSSATMLGKALQDPIKGITALSRVGVNFTQEQKDQIKAMVEAGDTMGAQKLILAELNKEYGGSAVAAGKTFSGQLEILENRLGRIKVAIGTALLPILTALVGALIPLADWVGNVLPVAFDALSKLLSGPVHSAFDFLGSIMRQLAGYASDLADILKGPLSQAWDYIKAHADGFITLLGGPAIATIVRFIQAIGDEGLGKALKDLPQMFLDSITSGLSVLGQLATMAVDALRSVNWSGVASTVVDGVVSAFEQVRDFGSRILTTFLNQIGSIDWSGLKTRVQTALTAAFAALSFAGSAALDLGKSLVAWIGSQLRDVDWSGIKDHVQAGFSRALSGLAFVGGQAVNIGKQLVDWIGDRIGSVDWSGIKDRVQQGFSDAVSQLKFIGGKALDIGSQIVNWIGQQIGSVDWSGIKDRIQAGFSSAVSAISFAGGKALDLGKQIVDWIAGQLSGADWSGVGGAIHDGLSGALSTIGDLGNSFGPLRDAIGWVQSNVVPILDKLAGIIESRVSPVIDTWRQSLQQCWDIIKQSGIADELVPALEGLGIVLGTVATIVGALVSGALLVFANTLGKVLPDAVQFVVGVIQILVGNFALIRDTVVGVVTIISDLIHGDWSKAWDDFKGLVSNTIRDVQTIVQGAVNIIEAPFKAIVDFVKGVFQGLYDVLVGHSLIPDLVNAIQNLITGLKNWLEGAWTSIKQTAQQVWTDAKNLVTGIVTSLKDGITGTVSSLKDWLENAWNAIKLTANAVWMVAKVEIIKIVSDLWQGIQDTVSQLRDWLASAWDTIKQKASDTWNGIKSTVSNLASDLKNALTSTLSEARDALAGVWDSVKQKASDTWNGVKSLVSNAKNDIRDAMLWPFQQARDAIGGIVSAFESNLARPWNVAADGINGFIRGLASAVNWVAGQLHIGGIGTPGNLIPHFARGGITPGGMFVAGEEGPELVVAPKGSRVYTKQQTDALFSAITGERGHPEGALLYPGSDGSGRGAGGITGAIEGAASSVAGAVGSVVSKATHVVSTVAGEAVDLAGDALNAVRGVISKGFDWLAGQAFSGLSIGTDGLGALSDIGSAVFSKLIDGAKSLARKWFDGVKAAIDSADADAAAKAAAQAAASGAPAGSAAGGNPAYDGASVYSHAQTVAGIYMYCEKFVGDVLNSMAGHHYFRAASAADHANMQPLNPGWGPLGAVQFWDWDTYGHVAFSAGNGGGYWGTVNSASGTGYTYAPGWTPRGWTENPAANGGIVQEPVIGVGLKSGQSYSFGEAGPERIVPTGGKALGKDSGGSDGITINYNAPVTISSQQDLDRFSSDSAYSVKQAMRRRGVR